MHVTQNNQSWYKIRIDNTDLKFDESGTIVEAAL